MTVQQRRVPDLQAARLRVMAAAMACAERDYSDPDAAAYAMVTGRFARACRDFVRAVDALPVQDQPAGWSA